MYKKTITYTDFDGNERTEDLYFNLSKDEMMRLQNSVDGGLDNQLTSVAESKDPAKIYDTFRWFVLEAYGEKSSDGRSFFKTPELKKQFEYSSVFDKFVWELLDGGEDELLGFINAVIPTSISKDEVAKLSASMK